jgi:SAM-dependent methyltransferase
VRRCGQSGTRTRNRGRYRYRLAEVARRIDDTQLTATDFDPPMLEIARAKFRPGEQIGFQPADAVALPFADASFDAVVCQFGVMFFPDKARSFSPIAFSPPAAAMCSRPDAASSDRVSPQPRDDDRVHVSTVRSN